MNDHPERIRRGGYTRLSLKNGRRPVSWLGSHSRGAIFHILRILAPTQAILAEIGGITEARLESSQVRAAP